MAQEADRASSNAARGRALADVQRESVNRRATDVSRLKPAEVALLEGKDPLQFGTSGNDGEHSVEVELNNAPSGVIWRLTRPAANALEWLGIVSNFTRSVRIPEDARSTMPS